MNDVNQPPTYKEEVAQYTKKDAIHALLYFVFFVLLISISVVLFNTVPVLWDSDGHFTIMGQAVNVFVMVPVYLITLFIILKKKGQKLRSIGLKLTDWKKALAVGLFFVVVFLFLFDGLVLGLLGDWQMHSAGMAVWLLIYFLILAFYEDVIFVGYIQTRIYGLVKNDFIAVFLVGILFAVFHYPAFIIGAIISGDGIGVDLISTLAFLTVSWVLFHVFINIIFRNLRSIIPVTLFHLSWNFALDGHLWVYGYEGGLNDSLSLVIAFGSVLLAMWVILPFLKKRKTAK